jgi:WD40 repeat protein
VQYNKFNDKLILTAGSDGIVNVLSVFSASSKLDTDDAQHHHATNEQQQKSSTKDKLAATMTDHTDSVWSATWSAGDPKLFASCSIVGRVICSKLNVAD